MIAATYSHEQGLRIEDVPQPKYGASDLLVRVMASSICGTDIRIIRNGHRKLKKGQKIVLGHEFAGIVAAVGSDVEAFQVGQRIGVAPNMGCGQCDMCIRGLPNMCPDYTAFGITMDGAHAEYVCVPHAAISQGSVVRLPDNLSFANASLIEPLSCVLNGNRAARIEAGDVAVVFGAGPIGLLHLLLAKHTGASKVIVVDIQDHRLAKAKELGATATLNSSRDDVHDRILQETNGRGADVVITACSSAAVQEKSLEILAPFGRVCFFGGLPKDGSLVRLDSNLIHYKNLVVTGVTGGAPRDFRAATALVATGQIDVSRVVSHAFSTADMEQAFHVALNEETMKVVVQQETPVRRGKPIRLDVGKNAAGFAQHAGVATELVRE
jgi:L-iditol 2-dehydrogenase